MKHLTIHQHQALVTFAAKEGRTWKNKLNHCWMYAAYPGHDKYEGALQQIRNVFGPTWLMGVRTKELPTLTHTHQCANPNCRQPYHCHAGSHCSLTSVDGYCCEACQDACSSVAQAR